MPFPADYLEGLGFFCVCLLLRFLDRSWIDTVSYLLSGFITPLPGIS
jgi:hypothetical protein